MNFLKTAVLVNFIMIHITCMADDAQFETRVEWSSSSCIGEKRNEEGERSLGVILASVLGPKLIGGAVDAAATALKAAGERKELLKDTAKTFGPSYKLTGEDTDIKLIPHCLTIVRGNFKNITSEEISINAAIKDGKNFPIIFQAKIEPIKGESYFKLVPWYLKTGSYENSGFINKKNHEYAFAISLSIPGADKPFASTTFSFINIPKNTIFKNDHVLLRLKSSNYLSFPPVPDKAKKAQSKREAAWAPYLIAKNLLEYKDKPSIKPAPSIYSNADVIKSVNTLCQSIDTYNKNKVESFNINDSRCAYLIDKQKVNLEAQLEKAHYEPSRIEWANSLCGIPEKCKPDMSEWTDTDFGNMMTEVTLIESRPGSKFAAYLGTALGAAKDDISNQISDHVIPSRKNALQEQETDKNRLAYQNVILADYAVEQSEAALSEILSDEKAKESQIIAARVALIKAKIASNQAYRAANLPIPYPELG